MSWLVSAKQYIPAVIGEAWGGGYFAGYISHTQDGNPTHALIVAPRATGATGTGYTLTTNLQWKTTNTATANTTSDFDGVANTAAMVTAGIADHPAAQFCVNLSIGGFTDWYLPSRFELDIAYFNLKPSTAANNTSAGVNNYSVPKRLLNNTSAYPAQTSVSAFSSSAEAFISAADIHRSSTQASNSLAWDLRFADGSLFNFIGKNAAHQVRAFRRIAL
jgi:hypothetical protein